MGFREWRSQRRKRRTVKRWVRAGVVADIRIYNDYMEFPTEVRLKMAKDRMWDTMIEAVARGARDFRALGGSREEFVSLVDRYGCGSDLLCHHPLWTALGEQCWDAMLDIEEAA